MSAGVCNTLSFNLSMSQEYLDYFESCAASLKETKDKIISLGEDIYKIILSGTTESYSRGARLLKAANALSLPAKLTVGVSLGALVYLVYNKYTKKNGSSIKQDSPSRAPPSKKFNINALRRRHEREERLAAHPLRLTSRKG